MKLFSLFAVFGMLLISQYSHANPRQMRPAPCTDMWAAGNQLTCLKSRQSGRHGTVLIRWACDDGFQYSVYYYEGQCYGSTDNFWFW